MRAWLPLVLLLATLAAAARVRAAGEAVSLSHGVDGEWTATTLNYTARVGPDGNLHSLASGGTEFLLDGYRGVVGGGYLNPTEGAEWRVEPYRFERVTQSGPDTVIAEGKGHRITYRFLPDALEVRLSHTADPTIWHLALNPKVRDLIETESGETISPRVITRDGTPRFYAPDGACLTLPHGTLYSVNRNSRRKDEGDPLLHMLYMGRTGGNDTVTQRLVVHARPTPAEALQATVSVGSANHIFPGGAPAEVGLAAKLRFPKVTVEGEAELVVREFLTHKEVFRSRQPVRMAALGQSAPRFQLRPRPGVYEGVLTLRQGAEVLAERQFPLAYDIDRMSLPERPADFDRFWDDTLAEQERVPANLRLTPSRDEADHRLYKFRFLGLHGRVFHGWLSLPKKEGRWPAVLQLPPSGINPPYLPYSGPEIVGMTLAIAGQEAEPPAEGYERWDYWRAGIERRETWYYRAVYAACSRAVDLLAGRAEVDPARIYVTGGSQGGGLTFITAGLNRKVAMAVSSSPGLFGLEWKLRHLGPGWWPWIDPLDEHGKPREKPGESVLKARIAVTRYGDAAYFASRIRCPVLLEVGLQDRVTAPIGLLAAWSQLRAAPIKALLADPWGGHNGPRGGQALGSAWLAALTARHPEQVLEQKEASGLPVLLQRP